MLLRQSGCDNQLDGEDVTDYVVNAGLELFNSETTDFCQMLNQFARVTFTYKRQGNLTYLNTVYLRHIRFVEAGVAVYLVKVVDAQIVHRAFVLHDIVFAEYPSDILFQWFIVILFDNQYVDLYRFRPPFSFFKILQVFVKTLLFFDCEIKALIF